jgi:signal transduction histidine kinase
LKQHSEKWLAALASGNTFENEARFRRAADGAYRWFLIRAVPLRDARGKIMKWYGTATDIEDRKAAEQERARMRQALNEQLIEAQEAERMRIAGELHDSVLQQITSLTLRLGKVKRQVPPDSEATATVNSLQQQLIQIGTDIRQISHELHPALLQDAGLPAALSAYCEEFSKVRGLPVSCETDESVKELSPGAALCIYRIAQEALGNVAKHAKAKQVEVRLTRSNSRVCLLVSDDGAGFNPDESGKAGGLGLINMRERVRQLNGTFDFETQLGRGTTVKAEVPFRPAS